MSSDTASNMLKDALMGQYSAQTCQARLFKVILVLKYPSRHNQQLNCVSAQFEAGVLGGKS